MSNKIDETGKKYGKLTVLCQQTSQLVKKQYNGASCWRCQCECGRIVSVPGHELRRGKRKTCGHKECSVLIKNEVGNKYDKLTVLKYSGLNKYGQVLWECKCDCGNIVKVLGVNLRNGNTKSCGCLKSKGEFIISKLLITNNIPFEKQKKFDNCRFVNSNQLAKFDFYINNRYLLEYDGIQHYKFSNSDTSWNTPENLEITKKRDEFKNNWCKENNIPLIRIPYTHLNNLTIKDLLLETSPFLIS